mgnify:CR=1 FL=1
MPDLSEFRSAPKHPEGWEPSVTWNGSRGSITARLEQNPDDGVWKELIADWGLDPNTTEVVEGSVQIRAWDAYVNGQPTRMKYYRATIQQRIDAADRADIEALCRLVEKRKPVTPKKTAGTSSFLVLLSDWQLGKSEGGGTEATAKRIMNAIDHSAERLVTLIENGYKVRDIHLIGLGDLVEACDGHYAMQTFGVDLTDREQDRLARRLIMYAIDSFVEFGLPIVAMGVPGNHGENRRNGKAYTDWLDNRDYSAFETVREIIEANPKRYKQVTLPLDAINSDDLTMTLNLSGVQVAFAHGHQFRNGANAQAKMESWWMKQALGMTDVADAQLLFAGHLHHFVISEGTGRTVIQVPAMDGGSNWFTSTSGANSPAGMVTLLVGNHARRGWSELLIV